MLTTHDILTGSHQDEVNDTKSIIHQRENMRPFTMAVVSLACNFIPYRICNYFLASRGEIKQNRSNVSKLFVTSAVNTQVPWPFDYLKVSFLFSIRVFFFFDNSNP